MVMLSAADDPPWPSVVTVHGLGGPSGLLHLARSEGYDTFINHVRSNRNHLINPQKSEITSQKSL